MKFKFNWKYYLRGTFVLLTIMLVVFASTVYIAIYGSDEVKKIFFITFFSIWAGLIVIYWIYGFIHEYRKYKSTSKGYRIDDKK